MKISCTVTVATRNLQPLLLQHLNLNSRAKHSNSTLAICKHPKKNEFYVIHFSSKNKTGKKYEVTDNVLDIKLRFMLEGKVTIQFKEPAHDLYIQADSKILKPFVYLLRKAIEKKPVDFLEGYSGMSVTAVKNVAPKKLVIANRGNYPSKGLPRTLEELHINQINRHSLDRGILKLINLKILDLSHNCIECIPVELSNMPCLQELDLSHNNLFKSAPKQWSWLSGNLANNLKSFNISHNQLRFLPDELIDLHSLVCLHVEENEIKMLPSGIGNLRHLKIFHASKNRLLLLPGSFKNLKLQTLDLADNRFDDYCQCNAPVYLPKLVSVYTLKELAARKVLHFRLPYTPGTLPATLIRYLRLANYCVCGKACMNSEIIHTQKLPLNSIAQSFQVSARDVMYVSIECYYCSVKCFRDSNKRRGHPMIR